VIVVHLKCSPNAVNPFAPETVEVPAVPVTDDIVHLPRQVRYVRVRKGAVFLNGEVYVEAIGLLEEDQTWVGNTFIPSFRVEAER
jgi:hypothetical protein